MSGPCAGIRVLDLSRGDAGALATMVLADSGADVVRVDPPGTAARGDNPSSLLLDRGKRSVAIDPTAAEGASELRRIVPGFDVVVEDWAPGEAEAAGLGDEALRAVNPALVCCSITGFGRTGPFAAAPAIDALVMAKAGIFRDQPGWERDGKRPIYRAAPDATYFAAMLAIQGILGALIARDLTGKGQRVETNMLQAITCRQNPMVRWLLREGEALPDDQATSTSPVSDAINPLAHHRDPREVTLTGMMVQCKDGEWIMHSLSEPHFFPAWIECLGFEWIWDDDRYKGAPTQFPDVDAKVELVQLLEQRMKEKTAREWMDAYVVNGNVCADIVQTTQDALRHRQMEATRNVIELDDPRVGTMVQVGPLVKISDAEPEVRGPAPEPGQHTDEVLQAPVTLVTLPPATRERMAGPLEGVTVVEAAYYYATPFATSLLAELGARVIRIEPIKGDPYRRLHGGDGDPVTAIGHNNLVRAMQGKESIALNLKDPRGREILHKLVAGADYFIHNFRGRVPDTLGMDEATLRSINPDLVYHYGASYGSTGPYAGQPAIDPVIAAFAGQTAYQTGVGNPPLRESGADPVAAAGHAAAAMLGLYAHHRSGRGHSVESAMIVSNIYLNYEDALSYEGKPPRPDVDPRQFGTGATHRLYETAPDTAAESPHANPKPRWVMLSAVSDDAFGRFCSVAGCDDLVRDPRFMTEDARAEHREELEAALGDVFRTRAAKEWETNLLAAGVGCVRADVMSHFTFLYEDAQAQAIDMMTEAVHPSLNGTYSRYSPVIRLSETPTQAGTFCEKGEHTRALLAELGYGEDDIRRLRDDDVIAWTEVEVAAAAE